MSALQSCLSLQRQQEEGGERMECKERKKAECEAERMWTETKMDTHLEAAFSVQIN